MQSWSRCHALSYQHPIGAFDPALEMRSTCPPPRVPSLSLQEELDYNLVVFSPYRPLAMLMKVC